MGRIHHTPFLRGVSCGSLGAMGKILHIQRKSSTFTQDVTHVQYKFACKKTTELDSSHNAVSLVS